jgi:hypothetical protein
LKNYISPPAERRPIFDWNEVPGKDEEKLTKFLEMDFGIDLKNLGISKTTDGKTVNITNDNIHVFCFDILQILNQILFSSAF